MYNYLLFSLHVLGFEFVFVFIVFSNKVSVTFFNKFAESFEKAFKEIAEEQLVVIIECAKVNKYDGKFSPFMFLVNIINY